jgi:hypothetical protein
MLPLVVFKSSRQINHIALPIPEILMKDRQRFKDTNIQFM